MLILKMMSNQDLADDCPSKEFRLIAGVRNVHFYNPSIEGEPPVLDSRCFVVQVPFVEYETVDGIFGEAVLTGNCYVLNDRGRTIETFWAREKPKGKRKGRK